jgi:N-acetylmuramoyl-L-alanine amidase
MGRFARVFLVRFDRRPPAMSEDATTLRWLINNKWGDPESLPEAKRLADQVVGYPAPGAAAVADRVDVSDRADGGGKRRKVAIVVGHNSSAPGADALPPIDATEYDWNGKIADWMAANAPEGLEIRVFRRVKASGYSAEIANVYAKVKAWGAEASMELHFNGAAPSATGTETLVGDNGGGWAERVQAVMCRTLGLRDRGVKKLPRLERGAASVYALPKIPQVLVEPFFGSNVGDCARAGRLGIDGMGRMYLECLAAL